MKNIKKIIICFFFSFLFLITSIYSYKINEKNLKSFSISDSIIRNEDKIECDLDNSNHNIKYIELVVDDNDIDEKKSKIEIQDYNSNVIISKTIKEKKENIKISLDQLNKKDRNEYKIVIDKNMNVKSIKTFYKSKYNTFAYILFTIIVTLIVFIYIFIVENKNIKYEILYLILAIFIYSLYALLFPMFTAHDELYHWYRAYEISEGNFLSDISDNQAKTLLPKAISQVHNKNFYETNYYTLKESANILIDSEDREYQDMSAVALYSPIQYIPQSLGITFARLFTKRALIIAYIGRFANLLFSILLIYISIKIIPFGKKIIFSIAFLPIAIEGMTSLSADAITISISLFILSYILSIIYNNNKEKITKKDYIILLISCIVLSLCKIVYLPIVGLCFIIPQKKFNGKKQYLLFTISIVTISIISNLLWLKIASKYLNLYSLSKVAVSDAKLNPSGQLMSIIKNPFNYFQILIYTLFSNFKGYLFSMVGDNLGWGEIIKPLSIVPVSFILLLIINSIFDNDIKSKITTGMKIYISLICLAVVALVFTSLYIQFTPPGTKTILGVQGRYFIPILPMMILLANSFKFFSQKKIDFNKLTFIVCLILNYSVLLSIFVFYL